MRSRGSGAAWLATLLLATSETLAYPPAVSFGRSEAIALPDGRIGQMRTLRAEGIAAGEFGVVLIGPDDRLLARSSHGRPMSITCGSGTCAGYDHHRFEALEPDSASFLVGGPIIPSNPGKDSTWSLGQGGGEIGFRRRTASPLEILRAEYGHARDHVGAFLTLMGVALAALAATAVRRLLFRWSSGGSRRLLVRGIALAVKVAAYVSLILMAGLAHALEGLSWPATAAAVIGGFLLAELSRFAMKAVRRS